MAIASLPSLMTVGPIGDFTLALPVAHRPFVVLTAGFLDFVVDRRIAEVLSARIVAGNRSKDVVPERHCEITPRLILAL